MTNKKQTVKITGKKNQEITINYGYCDSFRAFCEASWLAQDGGVCELEKDSYATTLKKDGKFNGSLEVKTRQNLEMRDIVDKNIIDLSIIFNYFDQAKKMADNARQIFNADPVQKIKNKIAMYMDKAEDNRDNCDLYHSYIAKADALKKQL